MITTKRLLALLLALAMCFALGACGTSDQPSESSSDAVETGSPAPEGEGEGEGEGEAAVIEVDLNQTMYEFSSGLKDSDTAITVNGVAIPNEMFFYWLSYNCYYVDYYYSTYYGMAVDLTDETMRSYVMEDAKTAVTYYALLHQMCEEQGIVVTEEQQAEYLAALQETIDTSHGGSEEQLLKIFGLSRESLDYLYHNDYLYMNYADAVLGEPTEADLQQYLDENGIFGVKHILLMTATQNEDGSIALLDGSAPINEDGSAYTGTAEEYNAAQLALAQDLLAQLQNASDLETLFDQLMVEYSEDGGVSSNPDGYVFTSADSLVGGFREATLELEVGEMSGIVETDYGYHILLRTPVSTADYADSWESQQMNAILDEVAATAEVVVSDAIGTVDLAAFYDRYCAYYNELYTQISETTASTGATE